MKYIPAKTIISGYKESLRWFGINYNMNIYKGCNHGCIYCDSRSDCYNIENFSEVRAKENAIEIINKELFFKKKKGVVGTGGMSDPYNSFEKELFLTRDTLKLINKYHYGAAIITKSDLVLRDIDLLKEIKKHSPVLVLITITTADDLLCKKVEPNVCVSSKRFNIIEKLAESDINAGILLMPVLPYIEDNEENILSIIKLASKAKAKFIYPAFGMTLRNNQKTWYYNNLDLLFPGLKERYIRRYKDSYSCSSPKAKVLSDIFKKECEKIGMIYKMEDIIHLYKNKYKIVQQSLF